MEWLKICIHSTHSQPQFRLIWAIVSQHIKWELWPDAYKQTHCEFCDGLEIAKLVDEKLLQKYYKNDIIGLQFEIFYLVGELTFGGEGIKNLVRGVVYWVGRGMSKTLTGGGTSPPHHPLSRENPAMWWLRRYSILNLKFLLSLMSWRLRI